MEASSGAKEAAKTLLWGVVWTVGACWMLSRMAADVLEELPIILRGESASGYIVNTSEEVEPGDEGPATWEHEIWYSFESRDGRGFIDLQKSSGRLAEHLRERSGPVPIIVEYDPRDPRRSRIKEGAPGLLQWAWRRLGLGIIFFGLCVSPGLFLIRQGLSNLLAQKRRAA